MELEHSTFATLFPKTVTLKTELKTDVRIQNFMFGNHYSISLFSL